jgi:hypothetical protein
MKLERRILLSWCARVIWFLSVVVPTVRSEEQDPSDIREETELHLDGWELYQLHRKKFPTPKDVERRDPSANVELLIVSDGKIELITGDLLNGTGVIYTGMGNASVPVDQYEKKAVSFPKEIVRKEIVDIISIQQSMADVDGNGAMRTGNTTYYIIWHTANSIYRAMFRSESLRTIQVIEPIEKIAGHFRK